jgi:hypothetical protein
MIILMVQTADPTFVVAPDNTQNPQGQYNQTASGSSPTTGALSR